MTRYILDASALLRFTDKEKGWQRVEQVITEAAAGKATLLMTSVNWGEVAASVYKRNRDALQTRSVLTRLKALPIQVVEVDDTLAETAAFLKVNDKLPFADAFAAALLSQESSGKSKELPVLLTADFDFKNVSNTSLRIEFLSAK
jgi:ribonuclease VapC